MKQTVQGIVLFSGGLDSMIATHLLKSQGISLIALHFVLPFYSGLGSSHACIREYAEFLKIQLHIEEEGEDFMEMVKSPSFGFGKNANPCIDCRIHRLVRARELMEQWGASFIVTGEVIGQRPKSQRLECLHLIERRTGLEGQLLRPLSARLLPETIPENTGLVDRSKLMALSGRSRKPQLEYACKHGLVYNAPAGGCLLTHEEPSRKYIELVRRVPDFDLEDFRLIAYGRHFDVGGDCRLIVARDDYENGVLEKIACGDDFKLDPADITGPLGILRGIPSDEVITRAASLVARYSRARNDDRVQVRVYHNLPESNIVTVRPATPEESDASRF